MHYNHNSRPHSYLSRVGSSAVVVCTCTYYSYVLSSLCLPLLTLHRIHVHLNSLYPGRLKVQVVISIRFLQSID
jgi:hypothetical protein